ncbi:helix-turn-helix domain-containing protein [Streptomyces sp. H10-C2]|uniref:TetR/AcrR family transcriptional regulator n=1 Tax=unclassified Streptomyces TaxID=2593676 RepID=UPI0024BB4745|nr:MULTISPECIES: helix-turn-helix domain-containing protein [unclassified Streptomyces]MDJ0346157.1 helix-turn-helix domain-containing protein [Streptomyces sp. PH10-H1]MDJ0374858.1 helix-turn-helix domain-containing protein [Streptomyces sp. H10-C2]
MHIQDSQWTVAAGAEGNRGVGRATPLRVDAQRNLEHVLRAAREVFGELGYGAPMEDVARRARVGVGTVYRRFPSKDVLVRRIAEEETSRLTEQARTALGQENEAWSALARFLRTSVASGAGRLLPPQVLRVRTGVSGIADVSGVSSVPGVSGASGASGVSGASGEEARVPQQRVPLSAAVDPAGPSVDTSVDPSADPSVHPLGSPLGDPASALRAAVLGGGGETESAGIPALLDVVGQLVDRARAAGELRGDVSVADVLLVIATAAPSLPDPAQQAAASARLLEILLDGLRSRPGERAAERSAERAERTGDGSRAPSELSWSTAPIE